MLTRWEDFRVALPFAENLYSFRNIALVVSQRAPDQAALAAIEQKLSEAGQDFYQRRFQDAIRAYQDASALIFAQIDPGFTFKVGQIDRATRFSRNSALFDPLLSASLEWMNVQPVHQPLAATTSRVLADPAVFGPDITRLNQAGLFSQQLAVAGPGAPRPALQVVADWQLATTYAGQQNSGQVDFFSARAEQTDPNLFAELGGKPGSTDGRPPIGVGSPHVPLKAEAAQPISALTGLTSATDLPSPSLPPPLTTQTRLLGFLSNNRAETVSWNAGQAPPLDAVKALRYSSRVGITDLASLIAQNNQPSGVALDLPHAYYYVIPLGLAECYHALGDYPTAESYYFEAAGYQFLNAAIEAPYLWIRIANLYLDWGNSLYRNEQPADALPVYSNVITPGITVPVSNLYVQVALKPGADPATTVIAAVAAGQEVTALAVNPEISAVIMEVRQQLLKLQGGLDFFGHATTFVPIWTFDYLQSVAINFAQLAISAERDFIEFQQKSDQGTLTRQELAQAAAQANAEAVAADYEVGIAFVENLAYGEGAQLAQQRATDAQALADEYRANAPIQSMDQAIVAIQSGTDQDVVNLQSDIQAMSAQFQQDSLDNQANEMAIAANQANLESGAANLRFQAGQAAKTAAVLRAQSAQQSLNTFDDQFFTPDVWYHMANAVQRIYRRYLNMALRAARLMQQAYNFETDQLLKIIKVDYSTDEVKGLLAADTLMADIQTFTYDLITSKAGKPQPLRQTVSLAQRYSFAFETFFRKTGIMEFETNIEDFDYYYPGTYAGRIEAVEVEVDGIVPVSGISGSLTNSGISGYRVPAAPIVAAPQAAQPAAVSPLGLKYRIQPKETLIISDYSARQDSLLIQNDQRLLRIFQGAGLASTWRLEIPKAINDLDLNTVIDVRLTFYYKARYDPDLHDKVIAELNARPGLNARQRGIPLRWLYPDAFFHFQDTGDLTITLRATDFRRNEISPIITSVGVVVSVDGSIAASGISVALSTPTHAAVTAVTDATGTVLSDTPASPWKPLAAGTAVGPYTLAVTAADNPGLVKNGKLDLSPIINVGLILGYSYTPPA
jgi:hypothetical protein